ncbi:MAG TPA: hypothetical protein VEP46_01940 [Vicinamibacterales bacterium]|nr:hypothetical protein [Vicinamibacterales bacterium]
MLIQIDIAPHPENRLLKISAIGDDCCWHGEQALAGVDSPRRVIFDVRELPAGLYRIKGEIFGVNGRSRGKVARRVTLLPRVLPVAS